MSCFPGPLVIIGSGLAGYTLAREFRTLDSAQPVVVICDDSGCQYAKPALSTAIAQGKQADDLVTATAADMADQLGILVLNNTRVDAIDASRHELLIGADRFSYGKLVLALGASPRRPSIEGNGADRVLTVNSLKDYRVLRAQLEQISPSTTGKAANVLILGGGLIGCELANDFVSGGYAVDLVTSAPRLVSKMLPEPLSDALQKRFESTGVRCHMSRQVTGVYQHTAGLLAALDNRQYLAVDMVVSAIGIKPVTDLAETAGLISGPMMNNKAVPVDRYLQTSDPDIYALGDCADVDGVSLQYVMPLMACARALAQTLSGNPVAVCYGPMPITIKTPVMPLVVAPVSAHQAGEWHILKDEAGYQAEYRDTENNLLGYALSDQHVNRKYALNKALPELF